ncbi:uncharacterized protein LOC123671085 [Harmonia axyridis]|uniref:uncharacterized protein LOC123671085 n=1 Tax=Harmonia axyridis TaxID=115357 RepID=UPI001E275DF2|nr:uncharacterized protein LOC123671085 [Harmonia axyridis]
MRYSLLIFSVISSLSFSLACPKEDWQKQKQDAQEKCQKTVKIDPKIVEDIKTNGVDKPDETVKEFILCLAFNNGFIDKDGNLQMDTINKHLKEQGVSEEKIDEANEKCDIKNKDDTPLLPVAYYQCYGKYLPRDVLVI